ncbi:MAG: SPASM domain-containing protein [Candidatus Hydrogenedentes bacterium]|nr:SPASM domain-containing protein [Candidatus Hydrogenedentota bacterium]
MVKRKSDEELTDLTLELIGVPKSLLKKVRKCCLSIIPNEMKDVSYLWIRITKEATEKKENGHHKRPTLEDWLCIVDECASEGVKWLVVTTEVPINKLGYILEICKWAQNTYEMKVGIYLKRNTINDEEINVLAELNKKLTQVFVKKENLNNFRKLISNGFFVGIANPQSYGEKPNCEGAKKLVFCSSTGSIYTCGLVEGKKEYKLGDIYEKEIKEIIEDPKLPHKVQEEIHFLSEKCDGCPSLLAKHISQEK